MVVRIHYKEYGVTTWIDYVMSVLKANADNVIKEIENRGGVIKWIEEV